MAKIQFIIIYFGEWPPWFNAFLLSCRYNSTIKWLIFSDNSPPKDSPANVQFIFLTPNSLWGLIEDKAGIKTHKNFIQVCDIRPLYGVIFKDYILPYEFWGHCDVDVIFGDIRTFISEPILSSYDVITSRRNVLAGHFTLYRNCPAVNNAFSLYKKDGGYHKILTSDTYYCFDEKMTLVFKKNPDKFKVYWDEWLLNFPPALVKQRINDLQLPPSRLQDEDKWSWQQGSLFYKDHEIMYLHFMTWKTLWKEMSLDLSGEEFLIDRHGVHSLPKNM